MITPSTLTKSVIAGLAGLVLASTSAAAVSLTNRDAQGYNVTVIVGDEQTKLQVGPNETLGDICDSGCVLRLNDSADDEYELEGSEIVSIEEGSLYYDGPAEEGSGDQQGQTQ